MDTEALIARIAQVINEETDGCPTGGGPCGDCRFFDGACAYGRIVAKDILDDLTGDYVIIKKADYPTMQEDLLLASLNQKAKGLYHYTAEDK